PLEEPAIDAVGFARRIWRQIEPEVANPRILVPRGRVLECLIIEIAPHEFRRPGMPENLRGALDLNITARVHCDCRGAIFERVGKALDALMIACTHSLEISGQACE